MKEQEKDVQVEDERGKGDWRHGLRVDGMGGHTQTVQVNVVSREIIKYVGR